MKREEISTWQPSIEIRWTTYGTNYTAVSLSNRFNLGSQKNLGKSIFASIPYSGKFELRSNVQLGERRSSTLGLATVSAFAYRVNMNLSYQFPKQFSAEVFGNYNSNQKNIQSIRPGFFSYSLAVRKPFMSGKGSIGLSVRQPVFLLYPSVFENFCI